ncbi:MAG: undecaprenyl-diphosphate phosphatase, partial [Muribaculaceae bacterium]|nr:undecaprenyl-diphosphate phosphatase [Muribaculaceae bacterium]
MDWLDALILGLVQGLSEYLPISSSGHLEIFREILGINIPKDDILQFDIMVHAATVCSTIVVLWPMFSRLCKSFFT